MFQKRKSISSILKRIESANDSEITEIIKGIIHWQETHYPEYEMVIVSLPKYGKEKRRCEIDRMSDFLKGYTYTEQEPD